MASKKISELTAAGALTGAELVEAVQGGLNVKTTTQDIADLATPPGGGVTSVNGDSGPTVNLIASEIPNTPAGTISATDVQAAITELDSDIQGHISDATAAHAATAISFTPTGTISATTVQAAIAEVASEAGGSTGLSMYNVLDYGFVADGVTDNSAAFTTLISTANTGWWIYFPAGIYVFASTVVITKKLHIFGDGTDTSKLFYTDDNSAFLDYDYTANAEVSDVIIKDIMLYCTSVSGTRASPGVGLKVQNSSSRLRVENVYVGKFFNNIELINPVEYVFDKLYCVAYFNIGLYLASSGDFVDAGDGGIISSYFIPAIYNSVYSIYHENGGGLKITNCKFNYDPAGFRADYHYYYEGTGATVDLNISNNSFENYDVACIRISTSGAGTFEEVCITGNDIGAGTGTTGISGIVISNVNEGSITGNILRNIVGGTTTAISLNNCDDFEIYNEYNGWTNNVVHSGGSTNIFSPVRRDPTNTATDGMAVAFDGTTGGKLKETPPWVNWSASVAPTGFSSTTTVNSYYHNTGREIHFFADIVGTSNATTFTITLPFAPNAVYGAAGLMVPVVIADGGTNAIGRVYASGSSTTLTVERNATGTAWTNSGSKALHVSLTYMV